MHAVQQTMAHERAGHSLQCSEALLPHTETQDTGECRAEICYACLSSSTETGLIAPPCRAGEEDAEDSDEEINEDLDIDAAADAFAAAARQKGFGDSPQPGGEHALPAMLVSLSAGSKMLPEMLPVSKYHRAPPGMAAVDLSP